MTVDEPLAGRPSVVGVARGAGGGRVADAQRAPGHRQRRRAWTARTTRVVRDGRLYGRGAYDMKGGLAAIMAAGAAAARDGLSGDVIVSAVADEEHASEGVQSVLRRWRADACIVTEPTHLARASRTRGSCGRSSRPAGARRTARAPTSASTRSSAWRPRSPASRPCSAASRRGAHPLLGVGEPARLADRRRPGAVELPRALRARRRAPDAAGRVRAGRRARAAGAARARARGRPAARAPSCAWASCASRSRSTRRRDIVATRCAPPRRGRSAPSRRSSATTPGWTPPSSPPPASRPSSSAPRGEGAHAVQEHVELESVEQVTEVVLETARRFCA